MQNRPQRNNFGNRWLRRILALLLGLLLFSEAGAVRAQGERSVNGGVTVAQNSDQNTASTEAERAFQEGTRLFQEGNKESLQQALDAFQRASELYRLDGNQLGEEHSLFSALATSTILWVKSKKL